MVIGVNRLRTDTSDGPIERRSFGRRLRRAGLAAFFASVAVNAALGIYAVLAPDFGQTQGKILGTSLCVTGAVLLALACEPAWERRLLNPVPVFGATLGSVGFALAIAGIWMEPQSEVFGKSLGSIFTLAVACCLASLLALARLARGHAWVLAVTMALLALGAVLVSLVWWLGDDPSEVYLRGMGVVLIAFAAFTVTVPVLHWVDRGALVAAEAVTGAVRFCPYCGKQITGATGVELACPRCGREFTVGPSPST